jgi:hypothetical protein
LGFSSRAGGVLVRLRYAHPSTRMGFSFLAGGGRVAVVSGPSVDAHRLRPPSVVTVRPPGWLTPANEDHRGLIAGRYRSGFVVSGPSIAAHDASSRSGVCGIQRTSPESVQAWRLRVLWPRTSHPPPLQPLVLRSVAYGADDRAANVRDARNIPVVDDFIPAGLIAESLLPLVGQH